MSEEMSRRIAEFEKDHPRAGRYLFDGDVLTPVYDYDEENTDDGYGPGSYFERAMMKDD